jgi:hypothetical protein
MAIASKGTKINQLLQIHGEPKQTRLGLPHNIVSPPAKGVSYVTDQVKTCILKVQAFQNLNLLFLALDLLPIYMQRWHFSGENHLQNEHLGIIHFTTLTPENLHTKLQFVVVLSYNFRMASNHRIIQPGINWRS